MLYIVQMIVSGVISSPKVFKVQASAQKAVVGLIREHCSAEFSKYCTANDADPELFDTALSFAKKTNDDTRFFYWELRTEADDVTGENLTFPQHLSDAALKAASQTQQQVLSVQTELRSLTEKLSCLSQEIHRLQFVDDGTKGLSAEDATDDSGSSSTEPEPLDEKYLTEDWREFVRSLIQMSGGDRGEFPLLSRQDWRHAIYHDETTLQYWEWVAITIDQSIDNAKKNGYSIHNDNSQDGQYFFISPDGVRSSKTYEVEDLAWCAAGLHEKHYN